MRPAASLRQFWSNKGFVTSAGAHALLLAATLVAFSKTPPFEEAQETVPVEMITTSQLNQIMRGEKTAKAVKPTPKVDKLADVTEAKPLPPTPEAKKDVPTPPPPLKRLADPGEDDKPEQKEPQKVAALPPPRPTPEPPVEPKPDTPVPPARPQPVKAAVEEKPEPQDAEPVRPKPVERPKDLAKDVVKEPAKEPSKPVPVPAPKPQLKVDEVAKLLEKSKPDPKAKAEKPVSRPKSGDESEEAKPSLDLSAISKLLDHDKPARRTATGAMLQQTASLGSPTASAAKMSPSLWAGLDSWMQDRYRSCWSYLGIAQGQKYVPQVRVRFAADGSLAADPALVNPPPDPAMRGLAESAIRAVRKCNPMQIPAQYLPFYEQWKARVVRFDPAEMT